MDQNASTRRLHVVRGASVAGNLALSLELVRQDKLREALIEQSLLSTKENVVRLEDVLESEGDVNPTQALLLRGLVDAVERMQRTWRLGMVAVGMGWCTRDQVERAARTRQVARSLTSICGLKGWQMEAARFVASTVEIERLRVANSPPPDELELDSKEAWTIGSAPDNDIVIRHPDVAKRHARLVKRDGVWFAEDLESPSGTMLHGDVVNEPTPLPAEKALVVGSAVLKIVEPKPTVATADRRQPAPAKKLTEDRLAARVLGGLAAACLLALGAWRAWPSGEVSAAAAPAAVVEQEAPLPVATSLPTNVLVGDVRPELRTAPTADIRITETAATIHRVAHVAPTPESPVEAAAPPTPEQLLKTAKSGETDEARLDALARLVDLGSKAEAMVVLQGWRRATMRELLRASDAKAVERLTAARRRLVELRAEAMKAIQSDAYTEKGGQAVVDQSLAAVKRFLSEAERLELPKLTGAQRGLLDRVLAIDALLEKSGAPPEDAVPAWMLKRREAPLGVDQIRLESEPADGAKRDDETRRHNEANRELLSREEWAQFESLNAYRAFLGRPLLRLDPALCRAARTHCEEVAKAGIDESDVSLAALSRDAGYQGKTARSLARRIASGRKATEAWARHAPDHRAMLRVFFHDAGVAQRNGHWTLVLGRARP